MEILVAIALLLAAPVGMLIYSAVAEPGPYERYQAMLRDPKQRARALAMFSIKRVPTHPIPRVATPIAVLANDRSEVQLLGELREVPNDPATRMVYADWLEQRAEIVKASFVRQAPIDRAMLLATTDFAWRAVVSHAKVPEHQCESLRWCELHAVDGDALVRECPYCQQTVRYCKDNEDRQIAMRRFELAIVDAEARF